MEFLERFPLKRIGDHNFTLSLLSVSMNWVSSFFSIAQVVLIGFGTASSTWLKRLHSKSILGLSETEETNVNTSLPSLCETTDPPGVAILGGSGPKLPVLKFEENRLFATEAFEGPHFLPQAGRFCQEELKNSLFGEVKMILESLLHGRNVFDRSVKLHFHCGISVDTTFVYNVG